MPFALISFIITVVSTGYQIAQARKQKQRAREAAEARKGFTIAVDGQPINLPLVYGRQKVAGVRTYHTTKSTFTNAATNAEKVFSTGAGAINSSSYSYLDSEGATVNVTIPAVPAGTLSQDIGGSKNEFLFFQQAICIGPIQGIYDVSFEDGQYLNDPALGNTISNAASFNNQSIHNNSQAAMRIDCHYGEAGQTACAMMAINDGERASANFKDIAFTTTAIRLDRENPQFTGVPNEAYFLEGRKIRLVSGGALQSTRVYNNNPSFVLLDYLLDPVVGRKLSVGQIDLPSFEAAAAVCAQSVRTNAVVGGKVWQSTDGLRNITSRTIPLYECNITLDTGRKIRDNISLILQTMGDAKLVWSQGKYRLLLQYPGVNNAGIQIAGTITDDDILMDSDVKIGWPGAGDRLNYCTVNFKNEAENFKDDSVSWPPKLATSYTRGVGGVRYPAASGDWGRGSAAENLHNNYGVWSGSGDTVNLTWKFIAQATGTHNISFGADDTGTFNINGPGVNVTLGVSAFNQLATGTAPLTQGVVYTVTCTGTNTGKDKSVSGVITGPNGVSPWTTRSDAYTDFITVGGSNAVYTAMLAEDNGIELEATLQAEGISDYYHALAKAEETVRTSRTSMTAQFDYYIKDKFYEPGDIIQINSPTLNLGVLTPLYLKVNSVKVAEDRLVSTISGTRFDWTQLAWNVADDQYIKPASVFDSRLPAPRSLTFIPETSVIRNSAGRLEWPAVSDSRVVNYYLYVHIAGNLDTTGYPIWTQIGQSVGSPFNLPDVIITSAAFGIRSVSSSGALSDMTMTPIYGLNRAIPPAVTTLAASPYGSGNQSVRLTWTIPENRADATPYDNHFITHIYRNTVNNFGTAIKIGETFDQGSYLDTPTVFGTLYYWVVLVAYSGVAGPNSNAATINVIFGSGDVNLDPPPAPTGLVVTPTFNNHILEWVIPTHTVGGGHGASIIYAAEWPLDVPTQPGILAARVVAALPVEAVYAHPGALSQRMVFWVREQSRGGGISTGFAGPVTSQTGKIGNVDLGPAIIEADNLVNNAITALKLDDNAVTAGKIAANAITAGSAAIANGAIRNALIENLAVDSAKIANATISQAKMGAASIGTAQIQDLSVTTAKIQDLSVNTLKIANNSVVIPSFSEWPAFGWNTNYPATVPTFLTELIYTWIEITSNQNVPAIVALNSPFDVFASWYVTPSYGAMCSWTLYLQVDGINVKQIAQSNIGVYTTIAAGAFRGITTKIDIAPGVHKIGLALVCSTLANGWQSTSGSELYPFDEYGDLIPELIGFGGYAIYGAPNRTITVTACQK
jgi:hypothetical protein